MKGHAASSRSTPPTRRSDGPAGTDPARFAARREERRRERLRHLLGLTQAELARLLEISTSTLARRPLEPREADRLAVIEHLGELASRVVEPDALAPWLAEPKVALAGTSPKELLASESGRRKLETYLLRALDGALL